MNQLNLKFDEDRKEFLPGETVSVQLEWELENKVERIDLRLFFFTRGHGDTDFELVQKESVEQPERRGKQSFQFSLLSLPYSFEGKLFSIIWAIEAELFPLQEIYREEILVGPNKIQVSQNSE